MATKVTTGTVRASFVSIFTPKPGKNPGDTPKYEITLLIPKSDTKTIADLRAAEAEAKEIGKSSKFGGRIPPNLKSIIRDGDIEQDLERFPEFAGNWYMSVRSAQKPVIVDQNVQEILDSTEIYSGCWIKANVNAFPYSGESKGISFGLNAVQKVRDDESFGAAKTVASDVFGVVGDGDDDLV